MHSETFQAGRLTGRYLLRVEGPDARHFLHNLLTADIERLATGEATYAALLTPQGKILFDLFVVSDGGTILIDCASSQKGELLKRLTLYKLRAKVGIAEEPDLEAGVSPGEPTRGYRDPRIGEIGWRTFLPKDSHDEAKGYDQTRIRLGLPDTDADLGSGEFFPHEANLDQLGGLSSTKGCYVGQEVVSRMEHRGTARSRILPVHLAGPAPAKGTEITSGGKTVGSMLSSEGSEALALLRLDRLAEAMEPLLTAGVALQVMKPRWVRYDVPGARDVG